jgi:hypothetical protein
MPRRNGTGPQGDGPMTGRGLGNCSGERTARVLGRSGQGQGRGLGRGFRNNNNDNSLMSTILDKLEKLESKLNKED